MNRSGRVAWGGSRRYSTEDAQEEKSRIRHRITDAELRRSQGIPEKELKWNPTQIRILKVLQDYPDGISRRHLSIVIQERYQKRMQGGDVDEPLTSLGLKGYIVFCDFSFLGLLRTLPDALPLPPDWEEQVFH